MHMPAGFLWVCMVSLLLAGVHGKEVVLTPSVPTTYTSAVPLLVKVSDFGFTGTLPTWRISLWIKTVSTPMPNVPVDFTLTSTMTQPIPSFMLTQLSEPSGWIFISYRSPASGLSTNMESYMAGWTNPTTGHPSQVPGVALDTSVAQIKAPGGFGFSDSVIVYDLRVSDDGADQPAIIALMQLTTCDSSCTGNCSGPGKVNCNTPPPPTCDKSCPETCVGTTADDCVPQSLADFITAVKSFDSSLPYLANNGGLICYWQVLPTAGSCAVQSFDTSVAADLVGTGATPINPTTWTFTELDCDHILNFNWPYVESIYTKVFPTVFISDDDKGKKAKAILKAWILHFGHFALQKDATWAALVTHLNTLTTADLWKTVSATKTKYTIAGTQYDFPGSLVTWLAGGQKDLDIFNYWSA